MEQPFEEFCIFVYTTFKITLFPFYSLFLFYYKLERKRTGEGEGTGMGRGQKGKKRRERERMTKCVSHRTLQYTSVLS
jgi:hypothetical protein